MNKCPECGKGLVFMARYCMKMQAKAKRAIAYAKRKDEYASKLFKMLQEEIDGCKHHRMNTQGYHKTMSRRKAAMTEILRQEVKQKRIVLND